MKSSTAKKPSRSWPSVTEDLVREGIIEAGYPFAGASAWQPHGYALCQGVIDEMRMEFSGADYEELALSSVIDPAVMQAQADGVKDFSERLYRTRLSGESSPMLLVSTIEAQISEVFRDWLADGRTAPFRVFSVRTVARHETNALRPLWKERFVWPFFEAQVAQVASVAADIDFLIAGPQRACARVGLPTIAVRRLYPANHPTAYADNRWELVTVLPDGETSILTSVYDLGTRFSRTFGVHQDGRPLVMANFAFSARLLLALLQQSREGDVVLHHPHIAPVQVAVVAHGRGDPATGRTIAGLRALGWRCQGFSGGSGVTGRRQDADRTGAPIRIEIGRDGELTVGPAWTPDLVAVTASELPDHLSRLMADAVRHCTDGRSERHAARLTALGKLAEAVDTLQSRRGPVSVPLCRGGECLDAAFDTGLDVVGEPVGVTTDEPCGNCGADADRLILLGYKQHGEK